MTKPRRIQLRRTAGWRLQDASRALNGLPARSVARPHAWANPYVIGKHGDRDECLAMYRRVLLPSTCATGDEVLPSDLADLERRNVEAAVRELGGHNLACWCPLDCDCHADLLLAIVRDPSVYI